MATNIRIDPANPCLRYFSNVAEANKAQQEALRQADAEAAKLLKETKDRDVIKTLLSKYSGRAQALLSSEIKQTQDQESIQRIIDKAKSSVAALQEQAMREDKGARIVAARIGATTQKINTQMNRQIEEDAIAIAEEAKQEEERRITRAKQKAKAASDALVQQDIAERERAAAEREILAQQEYERRLPRAQAAATTANILYTAQQLDKIAKESAARIAQEQATRVSRAVRKVQLAQDKYAREEEIAEMRDQDVRLAQEEMARRVQDETDRLRRQQISQQVKNEPAHIATMNAVRSSRALTEAQSELTPQRSDKIDPKVTVSNMVPINAPQRTIPITQTISTLATQNTPTIATPTISTSPQVSMLLMAIVTLVVLFLYFFVL